MTPTQQAIIDIIERHAETCDIPDIVVETLRPFFGKKVTKRMANAVEKRFADDPRVTRVRWNAEFGMYYIEVHTANGVCYGNNFRLLVAYDSTKDELTEEFLREHNAAYLAAAKARQSRRDALQPADIARVAELIDTLNTAKAALKEELDTWDGDGEKWPDRHVIRDLFED